MTLPSINHRRIICLQGFIISQTRGYIAFVTQGRVPLFGEIHNDEMILNDAMKMATKWWNKLSVKFPSVMLIGFVLMPNFFQGIIFSHDTIVGSDLRVSPGDMEMGEYEDSPQRNIEMDDEDEKTPMQVHSYGRILRPSAPLSQIVQCYETMTNNAYICGVKQSN